VLRKHLGDIEDEINTGILLLFWVGGWDEHYELTNHILHVVYRKA
jgi:hypothetical protein